MKPKLLFLITSSAWGGAERYVARLAAASAAEYDVTVMAGSSKRFELFKALPAEVKRVELPALKHRIAPFADLRAIAAARRFIDRQGIDLIHCNSSKAGLIGTLAAALSRRKPKVIYTAHGWGFLERRPAFFRLTVLWSERLAARFRSATIVLSDMERRAAEALRLSPPGRLRLIPHGIDAQEIKFLDRDAARDELDKLTGAITSAVPGTVRHSPRYLIGTIANAYPSKALPILVAAFDAAAGNLSDAHLVIIGDGPAMAELRQAREGAKTKDRIHLPGAVPDAARLLKAFDVFALSSVKEGLPFAILEASLAGLPIVATKVGAIPEMIEDWKTGLLVEPGDAAALATALHAVLTDAALREMLSAGSPRIAEKRSAAAMIRSTLALYRELR